MEIGKESLKDIVEEMYEIANSIGAAKATVIELRCAAHGSRKRAQAGRLFDYIDVAERAAIGIMETLRDEIGDDEEDADGDLLQNNCDTGA